MSKSDLIDRANAITTELDTELVERRRETKLIVLATIARVNMIAMGDAGVAKSMLVDQFMSHITGANLFKIQCNKDTRTEQVFGPVSIKSYENDEFKRIIDGKLPTAHLAFVDETTRANSPILDGCLQVINERKFDNGQAQPVDCPLWSFMGAANDWPGPDRSDLRAFLDRLGIRIVIDHVRTGDNILAVLDGQIRRNRGEKVAKSHTTLNDGEVEYLQGESVSIDVPMPVREKLVELRQRAEVQGQVISLRRTGEGVKLMQAQALLRGDTEVQTADLRVFEYVLPASVAPEDLKIAAELTLEYASPIAKAASNFRTDYEGILEDLGEIESKMDPNEPPSADAMGVAGKINLRLRSLQERLGETRDRASADDDVTELDAVTGDVERTRHTVQQFLGLD